MCGCPVVRCLLRADGGDDCGGAPGAMRRPPHHSQQQHQRDAHLGGEAGRVRQAAAPSRPEPSSNRVLVSAEPRRLRRGHLRVPSGVGEGGRGHGAHLLRLRHAVRAVGADARRGLQLQATGEPHWLRLPLVAAEAPNTSQEAAQRPRGALFEWFEKPDTDTGSQIRKHLLLRLQVSVRLLRCPPPHKSLTLRHNCASGTWDALLQR